MCRCADIWLSKLERGPAGMRIAAALLVCKGAQRFAELAGEVDGYPEECTWTLENDAYLGGYANGVSQKFYDLAEAKMFTDSSCVSIRV